MELTRLEVPVRWIIDHNINTFISERIDGRSTLDMIPLGIVQKRICWPERDSGARMLPLCKSPNNIVGYPTGMGYQSGESPFIIDNKKSRIVNCELCPMKNWSDHKQRCQKKLFIPFLMYNGEFAVGDRQNFNMSFEVHILELSRSGVATTEKYFRQLAARNDKPFYKAVRVKASGVSKNGNKYCVPEFSGIHSAKERNLKYEQKVFKIFGEVRDRLESEALPSTPQATTLSGMRMGG